jgi:opacity protein-like surface antigen
MNFNSFTKNVLFASILLSSAASFAATTSHKHYPYKGEVFKDKVTKPKVFKDKPVHVCQTFDSLDDGFYAGIQANYDSARITESLSSGPTSFYNTKLAANGFSGGAYLGDGRYFNDIYYLGAEVFGNLSSNFQTSNNTSPSNTDTLGQTSSQVTMGNSYGLSLIPGISVNEHSLLYIRLGYKWANFKYNAVLTNMDTTTSTLNSSKISGGFNAGVGIETLVYGMWSIRGEYTYTNFGSLNFSIPNTSIPTSPFNANLSPSDNQFSLGLTCHFA